MLSCVVIMALLGAGCGQPMLTLLRSHKPADVRDMLDTTRKWLIPFLEALDKSGFSRRVGDQRVVRDS